MNKKETIAWEEGLIQYKDQLLALATRQLNPILRQRISPEDIVQEVFAHAFARRAFFEQEPDVPLFFKLRRMFFQTLKDLERKHLRSECRDAYKEAPLMDGAPTEVGGIRLVDIAEDAASPVTLTAREDTYRLLRAALAELNDNDRQIIEMRHFDELPNETCARLLQLTPKAASIRYIRALERLQSQMLKFTEFNS